MRASYLIEIFAACFFCAALLLWFLSLRNGNHLLMWINVGLAFATGMIVCVIETLRAKALVH